MFSLRRDLREALPNSKCFFNPKWIFDPPAQKVGLVARAPKKRQVLFFWLRNVDTRNPTILLVDDEEKVTDSLTDRARLKGLEPLPARTGQEAIRIAKRKKIDIAIVDLKMPDMDGLVTIAKLKEIHPGIKTVLLTGFGDQKIKEAAEALDAAYFEKDEMRDLWDFIRQFGPNNGMIIFNPSLRPNGSAGAQEDDLFGSAQGAPKREEIEFHAVRQRQRRTHPLLDEHESGLPYDSQVHKLVGESPSILELKQKIQKVASLDCTVLIEGEAGSGKQLAARSIHMLSPRRKKMFMAVKCGSFDEELLSNELFGHEKEAFGGALSPKRGVFEVASGGTILLDEISDTPCSVQVKLLRVLQEKTVIRVGGTKEIPVDVRVLAATNRSLKKKINRGEFREDLHYTLNAFTIHVPSLRDRLDDISLLSSFFLEKYRKEFGKEVKRISDEVLSILLTYSFPGNVHELENAIEHGVIMCEGEELREEHLPRRFQNGKRFAELERREFVTLAELEKEYILKVLKATKGNKSEAARILRINRASLWRKLKQIDKEA
jgi:DNA-binding NtrC family response regulator